VRRRGEGRRNNGEGKKIERKGKEGLGGGIKEEVGKAEKKRE
jgi:hypothetical protein